jgi:hypothetical protein
VFGYPLPAPFEKYIPSHPITITFTEPILCKNPVVTYWTSPAYITDPAQAFSYIQAATVNPPLVRPADYICDVTSMTMTIYPTAPAYSEMQGHVVTVNVAGVMDLASNYLDYLGGNTVAWSFVVAKFDEITPYIAGYAGEALASITNAVNSGNSSDPSAIAIQLAMAKDVNSLIYGVSTSNAAVEQLKLELSTLLTLSASINQTAVYTQSEAQLIFSTQQIQATKIDGINDALQAKLDTLRAQNMNLSAALQSFDAKAADRSAALSGLITDAAAAIITLERRVNDTQSTASATALAQYNQLRTDLYSVSSSLSSLQTVATVHTASFTQVNSKLDVLSATLSAAVSSVNTSINQNYALHTANIQGVNQLITALTSSDLMLFSTVNDTRATLRSLVSSTSNNFTSLYSTIQQVSSSLGNVANTVNTVVSQSSVLSGKIDQLINQTIYDYKIDQIIARLITISSNLTDMSNYANTTGAKIDLIIYKLNNMNLSTAGYNYRPVLDSLLNQLLSVNLSTSSQLASLSSQISAAGASSSAQLDNLLSKITSVNASTAARLDSLLSQISSQGSFTAAQFDSIISRLSSLNATTAAQVGTLLLQIAASNTSSIAEMESVLSRLSSLTSSQISSLSSSFSQSNASLTTRLDAMYSKLNNLTVSVAGTVATSGGASLNYSSQLSAMNDVLNQILSVVNSLPQSIASTNSLDSTVSSKSVAPLVASVGISDELQATVKLLYNASVATAENQTTYGWVSYVNTNTDSSVQFSFPSSFQSAWTLPAPGVIGTTGSCNAVQYSNYVQLLNVNANNCGLAMWYNQKTFPASNDFTVQYAYLVTAVSGGGIPADGVCFVVQNDPAGAGFRGGDGGGDMAYFTYAPNNNYGPSNSIAVCNHHYVNALKFGKNADLNTMVSFGVGSVNLQTYSGNMFVTTINYNSATYYFTVTIQQYASNALGAALLATTTTSYTFGSSIASIIGSSVGYMGLTAATGGEEMTMNLVGFSVKYNAPLQVNPWTIVNSTSTPSLAETVQRNSYSSLSGAAIQSTVFSITEGQTYGIDQLNSLTIPTSPTGPYTPSLSTSASSLKLLSAVASSQVTNVWFNDRISTVTAFSIEVGFNYTKALSGAAAGWGFYVVLQNDPRGTAAQGSSSGVYGANAPVNRVAVGANILNNTLVFSNDTVSSNLLSSSVITGAPLTAATYWRMLLSYTPSSVAKDTLSVTLTAYASSIDSTVQGSFSWTVTLNSSLSTLVSGNRATVGLMGVSDGVSYADIYVRRMVIQSTLDSFSHVAPTVLRGASANTNSYGGRIGASSVVFNGEIYMIGGERRTVASDPATCKMMSDVLSYNGNANNQWTLLVSTVPFVARADAGIAVAKDYFGQWRLYVFGGRTCSGAVLGDMWRSGYGTRFGYDWEQVPTGSISFGGPSNSGASANFYYAYDSDRNQIYAGRDDYTVGNSFQLKVFDPASNAWSSKGSLANVPGGGGGGFMVYHQGLLLLIDGSQGSSAFPVSGSGRLMYNISADSYKVLEQSIDPVQSMTYRYGITGTKVNNRVYITGGVNQQQDLYFFDIDTARLSACNASTMALSCLVWNRAQEISLPVPPSAKLKSGQIQYLPEAGSLVYFAYSPMRNHSSVYQMCILPSNNCPTPAAPTTTQAAEARPFNVMSWGASYASSSPAAVSAHSVSRRLLGLDDGDVHDLSFADSSSSSLLFQSAAAASSSSSSSALPTPTLKAEIILHAARTADSSVQSTPSQLLSLLNQGIAAGLHEDKARFPFLSSLILPSPKHKELESTYSPALHIEKLSALHERDDENEAHTVGGRRGQREQQLSNMEKKGILSESIAFYSTLLPSMSAVASASTASSSSSSSSPSLVANLHILYTVQGRVCQVPVSSLLFSLHRVYDGLKHDLMHIQHIAESEMAEPHMHEEDAEEEDSIRSLFPDSMLIDGSDSSRVHVIEHYNAQRDEMYVSVVIRGVPSAEGGALYHLTVYEKKEKQQVLFSTNSLFVVGPPSSIPSSLNLRQDAAKGVIATFVPTLHSGLVDTFDHISSTPSPSFNPSSLQYHFHVEYTITRKDCDAERFDQCEGPHRAFRLPSRYVACELSSPQPTLANPVPTPQMRCALDILSFLTDHEKEEIGGRGMDALEREMTIGVQSVTALGRSSVVSSSLPLVRSPPSLLITQIKQTALRTFSVSFSADKVQPNAVFRALYGLSSLSQAKPTSPPVALDSFSSVVLSDDKSLYTVTFSAPALLSSSSSSLSPSRLFFAIQQANGVGVFSPIIYKELLPFAFLSSPSALQLASPLTPLAASSDTSDAESESAASLCSLSLSLSPPSFIQPQNLFQGYKVYVRDANELTLKEELIAASSSSSSSSSSHTLIVPCSSSSSVAVSAAMLNSRNVYAAMRGGIALIESEAVSLSLTQTHAL